YLVIGTIPAGVAGLLFHHEIEEKLRQPTIIGISVVLIALLMWWADSKKDLTRKEGESTLGDALVIGTAQALALWPGVSRSGITITAGLFRRLTRAAARSEEHTSELQSRGHLVCRLLLEKKKNK